MFTVGQDIDPARYSPNFSTWVSEIKRADIIDDPILDLRLLSGPNSSTDDDEFLRKKTSIGAASKIRTDSLESIRTVRLLVVFGAVIDMIRDAGQRQKEREIPTLELQILEDHVFRRYVGREELRT